MKACTVEDLLKACKEQVLIGNGNKRIYLSDDDEGNGYHEMYYFFTDNKNDLKMIQKYTCGNISNENINEIVILG